jgi:hypothetical protein
MASFIGWGVANKFRVVLLVSLRSLSRFLLSFSKRNSRDSGPSFFDESQGAHPGFPDEDLVLDVAAAVR